MADADDQVDVAREWLRGHGVEPPAQEPDPALAERGQVLGLADGDQVRGGRRRPGPSKVAGDDPDADPEELARTIVLRKLAVQARTRGELEQALKTRAVPEAAASAVLDRMGEVGLIDDATFAHDWVASRQQRRHLSATALRRELQTKGVDRDLIDDALAEVGGAEERRAALDIARRRAASMSGLSREVAYRRLSGVLGRRGFSGAVSASVLSEVLAELSALPEGVGTEDEESSDL